MSELSNKQKQELAKMYYVNHGLTAKEVASKVGATEQTIGKWIEKGGWKVLKASELSKPDRLVSNCYDDIISIQEQARNEKRSLSAKETDSILKLSATIKKIKKEFSLETYSTALVEFCNFTKEIDLEFSQKAVDHMSEFLKVKIQQLTN